MKLVITLLSVLVLCGVAGADKKDKADALFKQGKKLMADKRFADACEAFEESMKLDPVIGTQLNIAKCYEDWGKIGSAFLAYQEAQAMAKKANDKRAGQIGQLVEGLDSEVPRLTIKIPKDAPKDFKVTMDRQPVKIIGEPFVVDPGPKTLEWWIGDGPKKQKVVSVDRGGESEVSLDMPKREQAKPEQPDGGTGGDGGDGGDGGGDGTIDKPATPGRNQRIGGIALAGAGVLAIGVSSIMTLSARGKYNDALDMHCGGMKTTCDPMGLQITGDARSTANTATVVFLVGTAAVAGGVVLYLLAPKGSTAPAEEEQASRYIVPTVSPQGAGIVFGGRY